MLDSLFLQILNMSFTSSIVIIFLLLARLPLKKTPKIFSYALWSVVLFRLCCPFSFESAISFLPTKARPIPGDIMYAQIPQINTGIPFVNNSVNAILPAATPDASINPMQVWIFIGRFVWLAGIVVLLIYSVLSLISLCRKLKDAVHESGNIYTSASLGSPFVMGLFRPRIYLPAILTDMEKQYIILHEQTHIKRFDHVIKMLSFFVLCLHWFNPLVWLAFFLSSRDMELSCDEYVVKKLGNDVKKDYSSSLLALATGKRTIGGTPLAFGEGDTKSRIKNVLNYKKPTFWVIVISAVAVIAVGIGLIANPVSNKIINPYVQEYISGQSNIRGNVDVESFKKISTDFEIGADKHGVAVFKNPNKAFKTFKRLYADGIAFIQKENNLPDLSQQSYKIYKKYGLQMTTGTEEQISQSSFVSRFFDIYENSFVKQSTNTNYIEPTIEYDSETDAKELWAMRPMVMVNDVLYLDTGKEVNGNVDSSAVIGKISSAAGAAEKPAENGQCNFDSGVGAKYAVYSDGIAVLLEGKWFFFEKEAPSFDADFSSLQWNMISIQDKEGRTIYCSNKNKDSYPKASVREIICTFKNTSIAIVDKDSKQEWLGKYKIITPEGKDTTIYEVTFDDNEIGRMVKSVTKYADNKQENTLILSCKDYSLNFTAATVATEYSFMKITKSDEVLAAYSLKNQELAKEIVMDAMLKSAAWEGVDISTIDEYYLIRSKISQTQETHNYYAYLLSEKTSFLPSGTPVLQMGLSGRYSVISEELYAQLVDSFE